MTTAAGAEAWSSPAVPPLFAHLVDDATLLAPRATAPGVDTVVARYLAARSGQHGGMVGRLVCPASRLPALVSELARAAPARPVELALVVDTGLGGVPKALSTVASRASLLVPRTVETPAPPDVDDVWLERVSEFVPEDVVAVVEPRRPHADDGPGHEAWESALTRVAAHGCAPKLRCGGPRPSDVPTPDDVERFLKVAASGLFSLRGVAGVVSGPAGHGLLNLLLAVAHARAGRPVAPALRFADADALAAEIKDLPEATITGIREVVTGCGIDREPPAESLAALGLLG